VRFPAIGAHVFEAIEPMRGLLSQKKEEISAKVWLTLDTQLNTK
jgi:hypothetical protein